MDYTIPVLVFSMLGRFSITFALNTVLQLNYEIMPTQLRAQGYNLSILTCNSYIPDLKEIKIPDQYLISF